MLSAESFEAPKKRHRILYIQHGGGGTATAIYDLLQGLDKSPYKSIVFLNQSHSAE